jgi:hypothetical protein
MMETLPAVLVFIAVFLAGERLHPLSGVVKDRRNIVSFSAGMSIAYVFVRMMPELHGARELLVESAPDPTALRFEGIAIYFLALVGFLCFYGLDRLRPAAPEGSAAAGEHEVANGHVVGLAAYVGLMSYLLVRDAGESVAATALYTLAFGAHFLALDHSLRESYGEAYRRRGRWFMAGSCLLGWLLGVAFVLPEFPLSLLVAFISGGVIMTNTLMELAEGRDGRFLPFVAGSLLYGLVLVPLA